MGFSGVMTLLPTNPTLDGWQAEPGTPVGGERNDPASVLVLWAHGPHGELGARSGREKLDFMSVGGNQGHCPFIVVGSSAMWVSLMWSGGVKWGIQESLTF